MSLRRIIGSSSRLRFSPRMLSICKPNHAVEDPGIIGKSETMGPVPVGENAAPAMHELWPPYEAANDLGALVLAVRCRLQRGRLKRCEGLPDVRSKRPPNNARLAPHDHRGSGREVRSTRWKDR